MFGSSRAAAQSSASFLFAIDTPAVLVATDNLDHIYLLNEKNQLLKYGPDGKFLWSYSNKALGKLGFVDVTDPMRILLFYPVLQQAVVLNNNLNEIIRFNFGADPSRLITLVATANSSGFWAYDQQNRSLSLLGNAFNDEQLLGNIYQQSGIDLQPVQMAADDQNVFLYDPRQGIVQFDRFGTYARTLKTRPVGRFEIQDHRIVFLQDDTWQAFDPASGKRESLVQFSEAVLQASQGTKILAALTQKGIKVYDVSGSVKSDK